MRRRWLFMQGRPGNIVCNVCVLIVAAGWVPLGRHPRAPLSCRASAHGGARPMSPPPGPRGAAHSRGAAPAPLSPRCAGQPQLRRGCGEREEGVDLLVGAAGRPAAARSLMPPPLMLTRDPLFASPFVLRGYLLGATSIEPPHDIGEGFGETGPESERGCRPEIRLGPQDPAPPHQTHQWHRSSSKSKLREANAAIFWTPPISRTLRPFCPTLWLDPLWDSLALTPCAQST